MSAITIRPHARRAGIVAAVLCAAIFLGACLSPAQTQVQQELNSDRNALGLSSLPIQQDAQAKAQAWAEKLARDGAISHSNLRDGIRTRWCALGENVGVGPNVSAVQNAYMKSPPHRANIVDTKWNGVGVGHATNGNSTYTVQFFIKTC